MNQYQIKIYDPNFAVVFNQSSSWLLIPITFDDLTKAENVAHCIKDNTGLKVQIEKIPE